MPACAVVGCKPYAHGRKASFFKFPLCPELREEWRSRCGQNKNVNYDSLRVCSGHFSQDDYERDLRAELLSLRPKRILKPNVVPSLNIPTTSDFVAVRKEKNVKRKDYGEPKDAEFKSKLRKLLPKLPLESTSIPLGAIEQDTKTGILLKGLKNQLCRVCGKKQEMLLPIFNDTGAAEEKLSLAKKIEMHLPVKQITVEDHLPLNICLKCYDSVNSWHELCMSCLAADSVLRNVFSGQVVSAGGNGDTRSRNGDICHDGEGGPLSNGLPLPDVGEEATTMVLNCLVGSEKLEVKCSSEGEKNIVSEIDNQQPTEREKSLKFASSDCHQAFQKQSECCTLETCMCDVREVTVPSRKHFKKHDLKVTYTCEICRKKFSSISGHRRHIAARHNPLRKSVEPCCQLSFKKQSLLGHKQNHKKGSLKKRIKFKFVTSQTEDGSLSFVCPVCKASFPNKMSLVVHMNTIKNRNPCEKCGELNLTECQAAFHKCQLAVCRYCCKQLNTEEDLHSHEREHKIETCGGEFFSPRGVMKPQDKPLPPPPVYLCQECGAQFKRKYIFVDHLRKHAGVKYECAYCEKKFGSRFTLYYHSKKMHNIKLSRTRHKEQAVAEEAICVAASINIM